MESDYWWKGALEDGCREAFVRDIEVHRLENERMTVLATRLRHHRQADRRN